VRLTAAPSWTLWADLSSSACRHHRAAIVSDRFWPRRRAVGEWDSRRSLLAHRRGAFLRGRRAFLGRPVATTNSHHQRQVLAEEPGSWGLRTHGGPFLGSGSGAGAARALRASAACSIAAFFVASFFSAACFSSSAALAAAAAASSSLALAAAFSSSSFFFAAASASAAAFSAAAFSAAAWTHGRC